MARRKKFRKFLETAASGVDSYINVTLDDDEKYPDFTIKFADCDRRVVMFFRLSTKRERSAARRKLDGLRAGLDFADQFLQEYEQTTDYEKGLE